LKQLLAKQVSAQHETNLSYHFPKIKIKDSTKFSLPNNYCNFYAGYSNFSKTNGLMCLQYEYDLVSGDWLSASITPGLRNDQTDSAATLDSISSGDLHIRDLGYATPKYLRGIVDKGAYFLNRLPAMASVFDLNHKPIDWKKVSNRCKENSSNSIEMEVYIFEREMIKCRLIVEPVSTAEYKRRLDKAATIAKSKGCGISAVHKLKLRYNTFITNASPSALPVASIRKMYYLRWQIELVFKTWKSFFKINKVKNIKKERLECQILAKLIWVLVNWQLFKTLNNCIKDVDTTKGVSVIKFFKRCLMLAASLKSLFLKKLQKNTWLKHHYIPIIKDCICHSPRGKTTHYETLQLNIKTP
jgi:hypothetical protein